MDPELLLVSVYALVDDWWREKHPPRPPKPGRPLSLSESEVIALAIFSQWPRFRSERDFWRFADAHLRPYFPNLLSHGQLNRRIRALEPELRALQRALAATLADGSEVYRVPDTTLILALVERARESMARNRAPERKNLARPWELLGIMRCSCGSSMSTHTATRMRASDKMAYHYYRSNRNITYMPHSCGQRMARAEVVEEAV